MPQEVTDPAILEQLNAPSSAGSPMPNGMTYIPPTPEPEKPKPQFRTLTAEEVAGMNLGPGQWQVSPEGEVKRIAGTEPKADEQPLSQVALDAFDRAIRTGEELLQAPGMEAAVGSGFDPASWGSFNPVTGEPLSGTEAKDYRAKLEAMKAQVFLPMVQAMRGQGALSDAEGKKLTDAIGALDPGMSEEGFKASLNQIIVDLKGYRDRAKGAQPAQAGGGGAPVVPSEGKEVSPEEEIKLASDAAGVWKGTAGLPVDDAINALNAFYRSRGRAPMDAATEATLRGDKNRAVQFAPGKRAMTPEEQAANERAQGSGSAYATAAANTLLLGTMDELAGVAGLSPEQVERSKQYLRDKHPVASFAGDVTGSAIGAMLTGAGMGAAGMTGRGAALAGDVGLGAATGAGEANDGRLTGAMLGAAGGAAGNRIAAGLGAAGRAMMPEVTGDVATRAATAQTAEQAGIPVMTSDVFQPDTFMGKIGQRVTERIPFAGTGGKRAEQQIARVDAVKQVFDEYGALSAKDLPEAIFTDLAEKRGADITKYTTAKREVIDRLSGLGFVEVNKTVAALDKQIAAMERRGTDASKAVAEKLKSIRNDVQGKDLDQLEAIRQDELSQAFQSSDTLADVRTVGRKAMGPVYAALREDMGDFIKIGGDRRDYTKWMVANKRLAEGMGDLEKGALKTVLRQGNATPEVVERMLFSAKPSDVRAIMSQLGPKGQEAARQAVIARVFKNMGGDIDELSTDKFITEMRKVGPQIGVVFKQEQAQQLEGLVKALKLTRRANASQLATSTGQEAAPFAAGAVMTNVFGAAALPATALVGAFGRAYESPAGRNLMLSLAKAKEGTQAFSILANRLGNLIVGAGVAAGARKGEVETDAGEVPVPGAMQ